MELSPKIRSSKLLRRKRITRIAEVTEYLIRADGGKVRTERLIENLNNVRQFLPIMHFDADLPIPLADALDEMHGSQFFPAKLLQRLADFFRRPSCEKQKPMLLDLELRLVVSVDAAR